MAEIGHRHRPGGAGGKSRRVATNGASGRFELNWRLSALPSSLMS